MKRGLGVWKLERLQSMHVVGIICTGGLTFGLESLDKSLVIVYSSLFVTPLVCGHTLVTMATPQGVTRVPRHPFQLKKQGCTCMQYSAPDSLFPSCIMSRIHLQEKCADCVNIQKNNKKNIRCLIRKKGEKTASFLYLICIHEFIFFYCTKPLLHSLIIIGIYKYNLNSDLVNAM